VVYIVYIIEPHPGEVRGGYDWSMISQPATMEERLTLVESLEVVQDPTPEILVDGMDNAVCAAYGNAPNSAFVIDTSGVIQLSLNWENDGTIETRLDEILPPVTISWPDYKPGAKLSLTGIVSSPAILYNLHGRPVKAKGPNNSGLLIKVSSSRVRKVMVLR
jgi:hypothetical protein